MTKKEIYLAGGCFWGTQHFMKLINGVIDSEVGFANSIVANPSYKTVCTGSTNAAETVKVTYDADKVSLSTLLKLFFMTIDPTSVNKQGGDCGTQYRTGIYYTSTDDRETISNELAELQKSYDKLLAIETMPLTNFYPAEDYHQDYLDKNPDGYCHVSPELFEFVRKHQG
ncbi:MAG: peptide-methionine (S)-S-oxide reductase MsrA [Muribaculaceae bacterium]|nr:peptide-methionine (S)-S-oxide reductase MsrA [Muribaculaceae bacterium]